MRNPTVRTHAFLLFMVSWCLAILFGSCQKDSGFVRLGDQSFIISGQPFVPLAVNYILSIRTDRQQPWIGPGVDYSDSIWLNQSHQRDIRILRGHFEMIKDAGFNTVRLVGFSKLEEKDGHPTIKGRITPFEEKRFRLDSADMRARYLNELEQVINLVHDAGLKAILLADMKPGDPYAEGLFIDIAKRFQDDPTVMAYDLFNEPLYFDPEWHDKRYVRRMGQRWDSLMEANAPHQLWTLGLANLREFLEWDPLMLDADFFSFHPYEHEPGQVISEMRFYSEHCPKPWIIGETSIPADGDSVPYADQLSFAQETLRQSRACKAWGYSWWQFMDVEWPEFHPSFMGVAKQLGRYRTSKGTFVAGAFKPVVEAFNGHDAMNPVGECLCPINYYNWSQGEAFNMRGRLVTEEGTGIPNGVVLAWSQDWSASRSTVTKPDGTFELRSAFVLQHWCASAVGRVWTMGEVDTTAVVVGANDMRTWSAGNLELWPVGSD